MVPKRVSLPLPPSPPAPEIAGVLAMNANPDPVAALGQLVRDREDLRLQLELLDAHMGEMSFESICGAVDESQDVELYDGTLGVSVGFVNDFSPPVGQLQWLNDLPQRFSAAGDIPGNVNGVRWGSGGLIAEDLFLTAGHCFDQEGGGWIRPKRQGVTVSPGEIATLMKVNFNFQVDATTHQPRPDESWPVSELLEFRLGTLDFAIVRLGRNAQGELPGDRFGSLSVAAADLLTEGATLCVIQHPNGLPKKIEAGPLQHNQGGQISYDSIDTLGGSSGSPILSELGEVVGVHTNGGCSAFSGANFGVAIGAIQSFSSLL
jgi:V8-like Glu-specific endopeptidase